MREKDIVILMAEVRGREASSMWNEFGRAEAMIDEMTELGIPLESKVIAVEVLNTGMFVGKRVAANEDRSHAEVNPSVAAERPRVHV
jgi:hypothetical protein